MGAEISFEIAQQLHAHGERVDLLAALDASGPRFRKSLWDYLYVAMQALPKHPVALARYMISTRLLPKPVVVPGVGPGDTAFSSSFGPVAKALAEARYQYNPRPYPGRVTWFVNSERAPLARPQWSKFASGVERWVFTGSHATIFQSPAIKVLAGGVKACLDRTKPPASPLPERPGGDAGDAGASTPRR